MAIFIGRLCSYKNRCPFVFSILHLASRPFIFVLLLLRQPLVAATGRHAMRLEFGLCSLFHGSNSALDNVELYRNK